jgi:predicted transcriptional regulator
VCLLYASSPTRALVGAIRVATTDSRSADELWTRYGSEMALNRSEYDTYLEGASNPCAIIVAAAARFATGVGLHELRRRRGAFVTPQSYRLLRHREAPDLLNGQIRQLEMLASVAPQAASGLLIPHEYRVEIDAH